MKTGVKLLCADGRERLCFPIMCQYIADMEEQWLLGNQIRHSCPKCTGRRGDLEAFRVLSANEQPAHRMPPARLDKDARIMREQFQRGEIGLTKLEEVSYHPSAPFSQNYPYGGINDALSPDLLHQASKSFNDHLIKSILLPFMKASFKGKGKEVDLLTETDLRFALMTPFPGLRRFVKGVFTQNHHWTCREYKDIMRVALSVLHGLCPNEGIDLLREYIHVHRLSHYPAHTNESLDLLDAAIHAFWRILKNPNGNLLKTLKVHLKRGNNNWAPQRFHFFSHFAHCVREKGPLTGCSTDRTEPSHKVFKESFQASNKGNGVDLFILQRESQWSAMESFVERVEGKSQSEQFCGKSIRNMNDDGLELDVTSAHPVPENKIKWPSKRRGGWPASIRTTASLLDLPPSFELSIRTLINKLPLGNQWKDYCVGGRHGIGSLRISVFDRITVQYYVNAVYGADISGSFAVAWDSNRLHEDKISAGPNVKRRRDCILFRYPERKSRVSSTMDGLSVGRVRIFFKVGDEYKKSTKAGHHLSLAT